MQVNISARHGHLNPADQDKIREKVNKLHRFFDRVTAIHVTADLEHLESPSVEIRLSAEHTDDFIATGDSTNVVAALDSAMHKIEQQLRKHKEKLKGHRSQHLGRVETPLSPDESDDSDLEGNDE